MSRSDHDAALRIHEVRQVPAVPRVRSAVVEAVRGHVDPDVLDDIALAAGELIDNAVRHGIGESIGVEVSTTEERVEITVTNTFGPSRLPPVSEWAMADWWAVAGRGLGIVRSIAPDVTCEVAGDRATVTVRWPVAQSDQRG